MKHPCLRRRGGRVAEKPPRVQLQCDEFWGSFAECAIGAAAELERDTRVAELADLDTFLGGFA